ncbi:MAG: inositol-3-phosphate synthase, partial [Deltaproteobacteria bacterium]|nr:inositol-3-phosphate synthase [Deltaproteobacteria bacterium]
MNTSVPQRSRPLLLLVAGAKGTVASTLAVAITAMQRDPDTILPSLTTGKLFTHLGSPELTTMAGWDINTKPLISCIEDQGVVPENLWKPYSTALNQIPVRQPPLSSQNLRKQIEYLQQDIRTFMETHPTSQPVFINLLPAGAEMDLKSYQKVSDLYAKGTFEDFPDLPFTLAAIHSEVPVVNFTPNCIEVPAITKEAEKYGIPIAGRDGKTGQTYFKVALASALKARNLCVDGWYSLNILVNADGINLMNPEKAAGKLANKTEL